MQKMTSLILSINEISTWKYFSKTFLKIFHLFQGFRQSYLRSGLSYRVPFKSLLRVQMNSEESFHLSCHKSFFCQASNIFYPKELSPLAKKLPKGLSILTFQCKRSQDPWTKVYLQNPGTKGRTAGLFCGGQLQSWQDRDNAERCPSRFALYFFKVPDEIELRRFVHFDLSVQKVPGPLDQSPLGFQFD